MATREELQVYRDSLYAAYFALLKGERVAEVWRDGRRITYAQPQKGELKAEIDSLDRQIAELAATETGTRRRRALSTSFH